MKRIGLALIIATLSAALLVPGAVSATEAQTPSPSFWAVVEKAKCIHVRGKYGFGKVVIQMRGYARNDDPTQPTPNYIRITDRVQEQVNGVWVPLGGGSTATTPIYPDGTPYVFQDLLGASLRFDSADHPLRRMLMKVEFFDALPTGDVLLGRISARTAAC